MGHFQTLFPENITHQSIEWHIIPVSTTPRYHTVHHTNLKFNCSNWFDQNASYKLIVNNSKTQRDINLHNKSSHHIIKGRVFLTNKMFTFGYYPLNSDSTSPTELDSGLGLAQSESQLDIKDTATSNYWDQFLNDPKQKIFQNSIIPNFCGCNSIELRILMPVIYVFSTDRFWNRIDLRVCWFWIFKFWINSRISEVN